MAIRGFILEPTYRIEAGRPVVHLYGRLENEDTFLVRDDCEVPHFYVAEDDARRAVKLGAERVRATELRTFDGRPVARIELRLPSATPALRDRLIAHGIECYEADVRFAMRFLMRRGLRGALAIDGEWTAGRGVDRVYENPRLTAARWAPELRVLSFDIETDRRARRLLSVALDGCGVSEVLLFCPRDYPAPPGAVGFASERDLLRGFCRRVRELDPDVLTGWNVIDFDLQVLSELARRFGLPFDLGRGRGAVRLRSSRGPWGSLEANVPGRVVLDGIRLLRGAFVRMDDYSLDAVAREVLGQGKTLAGHDRPAEIVHAFLHDRARFVEYNLTDARLVSDILGELRLVPLAIERSLLTGMPLDRVQGSVAAFDFLYLSELGRRGVVAPSVHGGDGAAADLGGHVFEPEVGLYDSVLVFDFKSLYPSLIRTFQIDPLGYLPRPAAGDDAIVAPNGAAFRRQPGILTGLLDELFPRREAAKRAGDKITSHAIKILMNSFYGVLGTPTCRFYRPQIAAAITSFGRELLCWTRDHLEERGYRVLYGDTDSLFVLAATGDEPLGTAAARRLGERLVEELNRAVAAHVAARWRVESRLELEFEKLYRKLLLPAMRHGHGGARKRYAGLVDDAGDGEVELVGLEAVRRDWTDLAKQVQRELYERLFRGGEVETYLEGVVKALRGGELDELLVYRKALRKDLAEYTATTPPHVAAARKLDRPPGRLVAYVMTLDGPEPIQKRRSPIDHEHYVDKQLLPVAEPVLAVLGLTFKKVIGDDAQLELF